MKAYAKAYLFHELIAFPEWKSLVSAEASEPGGDDVVYIADDFTVLTDPIGGEGVLVDTPTEQWRAFCAENLDFAVPDDLLPADDPSDVGAAAS